MRLPLLLLLLCGCAFGIVQAQEATPEAVALPQAYREDNGTFTLSYPAGWVARGGYGQVYIANSQTALDRRFDEAFEPGEVQIGVFGGTLDMLISDSDLPDDADVSAIADRIVSMAKAESEEAVAFSDVEIFEIHDQRAAAMTFTRAGTDGYALIIDAEGDFYVALQMLTAPHEFALWLPTALAIAESIPLHHGKVPPPLTERFTLADGSFTIRYPQDWTARRGTPNGVDIASSPEALDLWLHDSFAPGDVHIFIASGSVDELFDLPDDVETEGKTLVELMQMMIDAENADEEAPIRYTLPESFVINDRLAVKTSAVQSGSETCMVIIDYGMGLYVVATLQTAPGESSYWQPTLVEMLHWL